MAPGRSYFSACSYLFQREPIAINFSSSMIWPRGKNRLSEVTGGAQPNGMEVLHPIPRPVPQRCLIPPQGVKQPLRVASAHHAAHSIVSMGDHVL